MRFVRRRLSLFALTLFGAGTLLFLTVYRGRPEFTATGLAASELTDEWVEAVHTHAKHGYWIVIRGTHIGDQAVAAGSAASLTHAALYDADSDSVIEAVGKGVLDTPLRELVASAHRVVIIEPRDYTELAGAEAIARARTKLGLGYDWLGTLGMPTDRRFYCTELAHWAYRGRERGWLDGPALHPEAMASLGRVVFDTGQRPRTEPIARASDELVARFAAKIEDARGVDYAALVAPGIYRGGVPDADGVEWLRSVGVKTVVSLRASPGYDEQRLVEGAGLRFEHIDVASAPTNEQAEAFFDVVMDPANQPVYVHCLHGVDRTGTMIALYRMKVEGWSNTDALAEMEWFGASDALHDLRQFVAAWTP